MWVQIPPWTPIKNRRRGGFLLLKLWFFSSFSAKVNHRRAVSSIGRALRLHRRGNRSESCTAHCFAPRFRSELRRTLQISSFTLRYARVQQDICVVAGPRIRPEVKSGYGPDEILYLPPASPLYLYHTFGNFSRLKMIAKSL